MADLQASTVMLSLSEPQPISVKPLSPRLQVTFLETTPVKVESHKVITHWYMRYCTRKILDFVSQ